MEFADDQDGVSFHEGKKPWQAECDIAMPCATQNELDKEDAEALADMGIIEICEGANMPLTRDAAAVVREAKILHGPGKAANAGGVAVGGLEQSLNAMRQSWSRERVGRRVLAPLTRTGRYRDCSPPGYAAVDILHFYRAAEDRETLRQR